MPTLHQHKPMRYLSIFLLFILLSACDNKKAAVDKRLNDTLAVLRKKAAFKPLPEDEAYAFLNKYYLPRLDTLRIGRKLFTHPQKGTDFTELFKTDSALIVAKYSVDSVNKKAYQHDNTPPGILYDDYNWDVRKLQRTIIADDSLVKVIERRGKTHIADISAFRKRFGLGYMIISYPQYNPNTNILVINEWLEDSSWCGTGRDNKFFYKKTANGWQIY